MGSSDIWHIIHLYWKKVTLLLFISIVFSSALMAQRRTQKEIYNPNYDRRFITYGFLLGIHTSNYKLEYSEAFVMPESPVNEQYNLDAFHSIIPQWNTGFTLGFIVNFRFYELLDARLTPQVSFYEYRLDYRYVLSSGPTTNGPLSEVQIIEATQVEFPILVKFKSERRGNTRAYFVAGMKPAVEVSGKKEISSGNEILDVREGNLTAEIGVGLDIYFPLFKFSPEIRYSRGLTNMHQPLENKYSASLRELNTNTITLYLLFQ